MRGDLERLQDILDAIQAIRRRTPQTLEEFSSDELIRVWVLHHLQIIGEACRCLSETFRKSHPDRMWAQAVGLRTILVHQYFGIDDQAVWNVVENHLSSLEDMVRDNLRQLDAPGQK